MQSEKPKIGNMGVERAKQVLLLADSKERYDNNRFCFWQYRRVFANRKKPMATNREATRLAISAEDCQQKRLLNAISEKVTIGNIAEMSDANDRALMLAIHVLKDDQLALKLIAKIQEQKIAKWQDEMPIPRFSWLATSGE